MYAYSERPGTSRLQENLRTTLLLKTLRKRRLAEVVALTASALCLYRTQAIRRAILFEVLIEKESKKTTSDTGPEEPAQNTDGCIS